MRKKKFKLQSTKKTPTDVPSTSAPPPPWTELPRDVTANILQRLGPIEILESAQKVCTTWKDVCTDPAMWRVIDMINVGDRWHYIRGLRITCRDMKNFGGHDMFDLKIMCRDAVDRSQGQLIEINIAIFGTDDLIHYISERSSRLRTLQLGYCAYITVEDEGLQAILDGCPNLELLDLRHCRNVDFGGNLRRLCEQRIKDLRTPDDNLTLILTEWQLGFIWV
ncbi:hypothetical protein RD792_003880 [Penstemon davidsonii]|uniref:F-box domain-containing protein n=1 Tax=Penstemon davidsonii TaxID=160366 RepID=A0ABR0DHB2_9LAMI|nr:hypothetical protein RD792_003880 [Penstemon davidsonii]